MRFDALNRSDTKDGGVSRQTGQQNGAQEKLGEIRLLNEKPESKHHRAKN